MRRNYNDVTALEAMAKIVNELQHFLKGWGNFENVFIDVSEKEIKITIKPEHCIKNET